MKNIKILIGILIGMAIMYGISNAYNLNASLVTYDKKNTTLESDNIQGAIDELGVLATTKSSEVEELLRIDFISSTKSWSTLWGADTGYWLGTVGSYSITSFSSPINCPKIIKITPRSFESIRAYAEVISLYYLYENESNYVYITDINTTPYGGWFLLPRYGNKKVSAMKLVVKTCSGDVSTNLTARQWIDVLYTYDETK